MFINTPIPEWIYFRQVSRLLLSESFSVRRCTLSIGFRVCESPSVNISINPHSVDPFIRFFLFGSRKKFLGNFLTGVDLYRVIQACNAFVRRFHFVSRYIYNYRVSCSSSSSFLRCNSLITADFYTFKAYASVRSIQLLWKKKCKRVKEFSFAR